MNDITDRDGLLTAVQIGYERARGPGAFAADGEAARWMETPLESWSRLSAIQAGLEAGWARTQEERAVTMRPCPRRGDCPAP